MRDQFASENSINDIINKWSIETTQFFVDWIPNGISLSLGNADRKKESAWVLQNSYMNIEWLKKIIEPFG